MEEYLKKYRIDFNSSDEATKISIILDRLGIEVYEPCNIKKECEENDWDCFIYEDDNIYDDEIPMFSLAKKRFFERKSINYEEFMDIIINKKYKKIENPIEDPYNEEDWGYEEIKENQTYNKDDKFCIKVDNKEEYDLLMNVLEQEDFHWAGDNAKPTHLNYDIYHIDVVYCEKGILHGGTLEYHKKMQGYYDWPKLISVTDYLTLKPRKKMKRVKNSIDDPYNEEDWGWEELKESLKEKDGQRIIFADIIPLLGGYDSCLVFLNKYAINKKVFYIRLDGTNYDADGNGTIVLAYEKSSVPDHYKVIMEAGMGDSGKGMIYFDEIDWGGKKFKKIENLIEDPYNEEDWGWEEIKENKMITKFKIFEKFEDIDPYGEEDWDDNKPYLSKQITDNLYVIYVMGQDMNFLAFKKERITDVRRNWKTHDYVIATRRGDRTFHFDGYATVNEPYPAKKVNKILNGEELVGFITEFNNTRFDTLQNICNGLRVDIRNIKMYRNGR